MEEDWKPFEVRETEKGTTLCLHGTGRSRVKVEADKLEKILRAIRHGWNVDIWYAIIDGGIDISSIELELDESGRRVIEGEIGITDSEVNGEASFYRASFKESASFSGASFNGDASFDEASFKERAFFSEASFNGLASFDEASFNGDAFFNEASFNGLASFVEASFNRYASFDAASLDRGAYFDAASFNEEASFSGASFKERASFSEASFNGEASFWRSSFNGEASFWRSSFNGKASFGKASFNGEASFLTASFKERAFFSEASFNGEASFGKASFNEEAYFDGASFNRLASFNEASFDRYASFERAGFQDGPRLRNTQHEELSPGSFNSMGLAYRKSTLSGASYFFEKAGHGYWNNEKFSEASEAFRDAKVEYEKEGKYDAAGVMYVWEKDSTRRQLWSQLLSKENRSAKSVIKFLWLNVWKVTCNYGEAPLRFIGWAAFIILFFALIYSPLLNWWPPDSWDSWALMEFKEYPYAEGNSFLTALYFSVVTFATLGFGDITPMNNLGKVVVIIEVLSGYVMFGILITLVARKMTRS